MTMRTDMTAQERQIATALTKALSLKDDAQLILNLDAATRVGTNSVEGAGVWLLDGSGRAPLHFFAPWSLFASALVTSFKAWGPEVVDKLKPYQKGQT